MNWTGGKLQRHSKANANPLSKAQKQHFAKARLQRENDHTAHTTSGIHLSNSIQLALSHINIHGQDPAPPSHHFKHIRPDHSAERHYRHESIPSSAPERRWQPPSAEPETLEDVRRNLLRNPDWLNLSAAKPVQMRFDSAPRIANVAKRRRITKEDRVRQQKGHKRQLSPASIRNRRKGLLSSTAAKVSVRLGSDIHRTQPTTASKVRPAVPSSQFTSSDTMLLDKQAVFEQIAQRTKLSLQSEGSDDVRRRRSWDGTQGPDEPLGLPTLDRFLDSQTFDQVKERSESRSANGHKWSRSTYPSSPPPLRYLPNDWNDASKGPQYGSSARRDSEGNSSFFPDKRVQREHQEDTFMRDKKSGEPSQNAAEKRQSSPDERRSRPLYTLDKQIELERGTPSPISTYNARPGPGNSATGNNRLQNGNLMYRHEEVLLDSPRGNVDSRPTASYTRSVGPSRSSPLQHMASTVKRSYSNMQKVSGRIDEDLDAKKDNEAWMKFILGDELDEINEAFTFDPARHTPVHNAKRRRTDGKRECGQTSSLEALTWTTGRGLRTPKTVRTSANTVLYTLQRSKPNDHSETDFLSQLSPMEGIIDDRLGEVSVYNNAARTERSFITAPQIGSSRSHKDAEFITSTPRPHQARPEDPSHLNCNGSTSSNYSPRPSQVTHGTPREYSSTPVPPGAGGQISSYFSTPIPPIITASTPRPVRSALSEASSITEPGHSSTHRQPLQNIHTGVSHAFVFNKPPSFLSTKSPSVSGSYNNSRISDRFIMPDRVAKR